MEFSTNIYAFWHFQVINKTFVFWQNIEISKKNTRKKKKKKKKKCLFKLKAFDITMW